MYEFEGTYESCLLYWRNMCIEEKGVDHVLVRYIEGGNAMITTVNNYISLVKTENIGPHRIIVGPEKDVEPEISGPEIVIGGGNGSENADS